MVLPCSFLTATSPEDATPLRLTHACRLAWALLASLLLHLALIGDIANFHWSAPSPPAPPLQVQFLRDVDDIRLAERPGNVQARVADGPVHPAEAEAQAPAAPLPAGHPVYIDPPAVPPIRDRTLPTPPDSAMARNTASPDNDPAKTLADSGKLVYRFYWGKGRWPAGLATHEWTIENGYYTLTSTVVTTGLFAWLRPTRLIETAKGIAEGDKLLPQQFATEWNERPLRVTIFNRDKSYVRWYRDGTVSTQPLPANVYDKISFLYQLCIARRKEDFFSAEIALGNSLDHYDIQNLGTEEIEIDGKTHPATHLKRATSSAEMVNVDIWISTSTNLPLKMIYANQAGEYYEQQLVVDSPPPG